MQQDVERQMQRVFTAQLVVRTKLDDGDLLNRAFEPIAAGIHFNFVALCRFNGDRRAQPSALTRQSSLQQGSA